MSQTFSTSIASIAAQSSRYRAEASGGNTSAAAVPDLVGKNAPTSGTDAEVVIGALVSQYFRCSTSASGFFRFW